MSDNPLDPSEATLQRIRERAYHLWQADGGPDGHDLEYWERARELVGMEGHPGAGLLPNPMTEHGGAIPPVQPVEEAALMENLGEFPDRLSDQGERATAPMTKEAAATRARQAG